MLCTENELLGLVYFPRSFSFYNFQPSFAAETRLQQVNIKVASMPKLNQKDLAKKKHFYL